MKKVLVSVVGTSPAVLTETVWALVSAKEPVVVDEIVVLTTTTGEKGLRDALFGSDRIWEKMVQALERKTGLSLADKLQFGHRDSIRLFHRGKDDLADIVTPEDNTAVADQILETLCAYTEDPTTQVYASLAGGRKSMSALMMAAMSLRGREGDHVLHVLVNEPFDKPLTPRFYFPARGVTHEFGGRKYRSTSARIDLIDIPFVKMRGWYQDRFKTAVPHYSELVKSVQSQVADYLPLLEFDFEHGWLMVDGDAVKLSGIELMALVVQTHSAGRNDMLRAIAEWKKGGNTKVDWICEFKESEKFCAVFDETDAKNESLASDLSKTLNSLRRKLAAVPKLSHLIDRLVPRRFQASTYDKSRISADIRKLHQLFRV